MADAKRYYWLRLHDDFFDSKRIKKLRKMAGGDTYTIIYLKMQLLAMKTDGALTWTGLEDSIADELALDLDESPDDVKVTLAYLTHCGLVETSDNINFFLPYAIANTGSESASTQRVREYRERQKALQCNNDETTMKQICSVEKEIEKEIEIKERDKEESIPTPRKEKHKFGPYKNVLLTDEEQQKLIDDYGLEEAMQAVNYLSEYIEMKGAKYKSHYLALRKWVFDALKEKRGKKTYQKPSQLDELARACEELEALHGHTTDK